ncbi:MAG: translation initiation factor IF-3 [Erysipelotrichaceae bacterium]
MSRINKNFRGAPRNKDNELVNDKIRFREVLVIDADGEQLGVMSLDDALDRAYEQNLDLHCVAPQAKPPVCKIVDYGRFKFEQKKKLKESKKNQATTEIKPIRVSPVIDEHDFQTKLKHARKWLDDGMKVKIDMRFRGRMMTRQDVGKKVMERFIEETADLGTVEKRPKLEGNIMSAVISANKKK